MYITRLDDLRPGANTPEEYEERIGAVGAEGWAKALAVWRATVWAGSQGPGGAVREGE